MTEVKSRLVSVVIDGKEMKVPADNTILHVLKLNDIDVPHLCHDVRLPQANGNCGLCVVELLGEDRFIKSCETPIKEGMNISTNNENLRTYRRIRLKQILNDHNADCVAPCVVTCPAHIDIQQYLRQAGDGNFDGALKIIKDRNPFPGVCGRVCPHPCEAECRRNLVDEPVGINNVKRFVADLDLFSEFPYLAEKEEPSGKKIAIIGAGPSGLSCAYYSALNGHDVTVFDQQPKPGGMMMYGIPEYRLPKATLGKEIALIEKLGVKIECGKKLGTNLRLENLKKDFDAVYLAVGSWKGNTMRIPGESSRGVLLGIDYLESIIKGEEVGVCNKVIVVGGGNTAIDCARTARRQGADVTLVYRRTEEDMPAESYEVEEAKEEGVKLVLLAAPVKIITDEVGAVKSMEFIKMESGEPDLSGRRRVTPIEGTEFVLDTTCVISAIGQETDTTYLWNDLPVKMSQWGDVEINGKTMETSEGKIFAGGDCVTGPATVIQAVGAGRQGAECINDYLYLGYVPQRKEEYHCSRGTLEDLPRHEFEIMPRIKRGKIQARPMSDHPLDFEEIAIGLTEAQAVEEAKRCLDCGCDERYNCTLRDTATEYDVHHEKALRELMRLPIMEDHPYIVRDHNKCIACGRCIAVCKYVEGPGVLDFYMKDGKLRVGTATGARLEDTNCVNCGQCIATCPCGALDKKSHVDRVFQAINNPDITVVGFMAPAVRTVIASKYGMEAEEATAYTAGMLKAIGVDKVFDVNFTADLTINEETTEFLGRVTNGGVLPQFTSCCPGWVTYVEKKYPEFIPNLSTCKSPQQMLGALMKHHYPDWAGLDKKKVFTVSVMPCIAKMYESSREDFILDGVTDIDAVITTVDLLDMISKLKLEDKIVPTEMDQPYQQSSGAACLFGVSGGVAEAALRMAADELSGVSLDAIEYDEIRGLEGVKDMTVTVGDTTVRIGIVNGLKNAEPLLEAMKAGTSVGYHLIEVMACPGGCIDGAGQPVPENSRELTNRQNIIYNIDKGEKLRKSQENPDIISLYDDFFEKPNSPLAHKLLHTHYHDRRTKEHVGNREESTYKQKVVEVCVDKHCAAKGSQEILDNLKLFVKENQLEGFLRVKSQMCKGHCKDEGVFVTVDKRKVDVEKLKDINSFVGEILKDMK